jgi:O-methyltransferase
MSVLARSARWLARSVGVELSPYRAPQGLEAHIAETVRRVAPYTMTSEARVVALCDAVRHVVENGIEGDFVECGVWRGGSVMAMARTLLQFCDTSRHLHLFDTFDGMTEPDSRDVAVDGKPAAELMRASSKAHPRSVWCYAPLEEVKSAVGSVGYPTAQIHYVKGPVETTLPRAAPEKIALLRLDTDWYGSTYHELVHLYPRLAVGGVLFIDDYGHWKGARRAVDQFIAERKLPLYLHRIDYSGRSAIKWR